MTTGSVRVAVVAIGRNEGERLRRCLESVLGAGRPVVYVDSGSTDGSCEMARGLGATVVQLDLSVPFTAARARNAGFDGARARFPDLELVQFVDGDCEVVEGWLDRAVKELADHPEYAAVCGRRRERHPDRTVYNRLCDLEWNTPVGITKACGGDAMIRVEAFSAVGGYNGSVIAGEDDELCVRLREAGWSIARIAAEMTVHDAAMTRFGQWWNRAVRAGHCFAEGYALHGRPPERMWLRKNLSVLFSGVVVPALTAALCLWFGWWGLLALAWYPVSTWRTYRALVRAGVGQGDARLYAMNCVLASFPNARGQLKFLLTRLRGRRSKLIEYK